MSQFFLNWLIGWTSAAIASTIAMPFDTVKRVMMVAEQKYKNMFHCWTDLVKRHGITRLWRGTHPLPISSKITPFRNYF